MNEMPNLIYIRKVAKGDHSFTRNLIAVIKRELSGDAAAYRLHLKNQSFRQSSDYVHKLCHKIRILGLEKGHKIAEEYRADLLENNLKLKSEFENILTSMLLFIKKVEV